MSSIEGQTLIFVGKLFETMRLSQILSSSTMIPHIFQWALLHTQDILIPAWYGICFGAILLVWTLLRAISRLTSWGASKTTVCLLKHIRYRQLPHIVQRCDIETCAIALLVVTYLGVNTLWLLLKAGNVENMGNRAGILALFNLLPLLAGLRSSVPAELLGVSLSGYQRAHRWIGRTCTVEVLLHGCISLINHTLKVTTTPMRASTYFPLLAGGCLLLMVPLIIGGLVRRFRVITINTHLLLGAVMVFALWEHLSRISSHFQWCLIGGLGVGVVLNVIPCVIDLCRNRPWRPHWPRARVEPSHGILKIRLDVPPTWRTKPGQYVQLWCWGLGYRACFQILTLVVAYCKDDNDRRELYLFTRPGRHGMLARLWANLHRLPGRRMQRADGEIYSFPVLVLGPHGQSHDFRLFGTVLMVTTDLGIAGVLPYIRSLVETSRQRRAMVRKVEVVWQVEDYEHLLWLSDCMQGLLDEDHDDGFNVLQFTIYYRIKRSGTRVTNTRRISCLQEPLNVVETVEAHLKTRQGDMAIVVCASSPVDQIVQSTVQKRMEEGLRLIKLEFQPSSRLYTPWITVPTSSKYLQSFISAPIHGG